MKGATISHRGPEAVIFESACAHYEHLLDEAYGRSYGKTPDPAGACEVASEWIGCVRRLLAYSDTSIRAQQYVLESERMREALIASLCAEIGEDWELIHSLAATHSATEPLTSEVQFGYGGHLRLGWLRLLSRLSRPFLEEGLQKHRARKVLNS